MVHYRIGGETVSDPPYRGRTGPDAERGRAEGIPLGPALERMGIVSGPPLPFPPVSNRVRYPWCWRRAGARGRDTDGVYCAGHRLSSRRLRARRARRVGGREAVTVFSVLAAILAVAAVVYLVVAGVAAARDLPEADVRALVESKIQGRDLGYLGEPTVNVLQLISPSRKRMSSL